MYYFIVNPSSSSGKGFHIWKTIEQLLKKEQVSYRVFFTQSGHHASRLANRICLTMAPATIIAVGGDGTANDIINGLANFPGITFGYIPTGSGNDLARGFHLSADPKEALHAILHPSKIEQAAIGVLETDTFRRRFAVSSGIGFDAAVCAHNLHSDLKDFLNRFNLGKLSYTAVALKQICRLKSARLSLSLDGQKPLFFNGFFFAAAMNLPCEGGGFRFCPDACGSDDLLNLCLLKKMNKLKLLALLPLAFFGRHTRFSEIHLCSFRRAVLKSDRELYIHTDGEIPGTTRQLTWYLEEERLPFITG